MIAVTPIATVKNEIDQPKFKNWDLVVSEISLVKSFQPFHLSGIEQFKLLEVIYLSPQYEKFFVSSKPEEQEGLFSKRTGSRPNNIGTAIVKLLRKKERSIIVQGLDAMNGTSVLDIRPFDIDAIPKN